MVTIRIGEREESLTWEQWEQRVADGRVPTTALVRFEPVTGDAFQPAGELDLFHSLRDDARRDWADRYRSGSPPWMTALVVGVQIRLWWLMKTGDLVEVKEGLHLWQPAVLEDGEVWRVMTAGLTHWSVGHIVSNLVMMAYVGWFLERALGRINLLIIFCMSVLGGSLLSMFMTPSTGSLGASGGVLGIVAAATVFGFIRFNLLPDRARVIFGWALLPYLCLIYGMGWMSETTDNWAHTGGLVVGGLLALVLDPPGLERRARWNGIWWATCGGAALALFGTLWFFGPAFMRVDDVAERSRIPRDRTEHRELVWTAPTTWTVGRIEGTQGFRSPAYGRRGWAVQARTRTRPADPATELAQWRESLSADWQTAVTFDPPQAAALAGHDGLHQVAHLDDGDGATIERWVATRGSYALEATWSVDDPVAYRLSGLRDQLLADIVWNEPDELIQAQDDLDRSPGSRPLRRRLANALLTAGEVEASKALWQTLVRERPSTPDGWVGLLEVARLYPDAIPDRDRLYRDAIAQNLPEVHAEIALALHGEGREETAVGLLELGWLEAPGDRYLRRARKLVSLPTRLEGTQPEHVLYDPRTGSALADPRRTPSAEAASMERATEVGREVLAERRAQLDEAITLPLPRAIPVLLLARDGALPTPTSARDRVHELAVDLKSMGDGIDLPWLPPEVQAALVAKVREQGLEPAILPTPEQGAPESDFNAWIDRMGLEAVEGPRGLRLRRY